MVVMVFQNEKKRIAILDRESFVSRLQSDSMSLTHTDQGRVFALKKRVLGQLSGEELVVLANSSIVKKQTYLNGKGQRNRSRDETAAKVGTNVESMDSSSIPFFARDTAGHMQAKEHEDQ